MQEDFHLLLVKPENFQFVESFRDVMECLQEGLRQLGYGAPIVENRVLSGLTPIVFGSHHVGDGQLPPHTIIYNLEQLMPGYPWYGDAYLSILKRFRVWDFHPRNVAHLLEAGINTSARLVPLGCTPCMARIAPAPQQDVDVLFYGLKTERRVRVLEALGRAGLTAVALHNVWGAQRDGWIARAKVVLNVHQNDRGLFEIVRVLHLLANRKAVVCECATPEEIDTDLRAGVRAASYDGLVDACIDLVRDHESRKAMEAAAFAAATAPERQMANILARHIPRRGQIGEAAYA